MKMALNKPHTDLSYLSNPSAKSQFSGTALGELQRHWVGLVTICDQSCSGDRLVFPAWLLCTALWAGAGMGPAKPYEIFPAGRRVSGRRRGRLQLSTDQNKKQNIYSPHT